MITLVYSKRVSVLNNLLHSVFQKVRPVLKTLPQDLSDATLRLSKIQELSDFLMQTKSFVRHKKKFGTKVFKTGLPNRWDTQYKVQTKLS